MGYSFDGSPKPDKLGQKVTFVLSLVRTKYDIQSQPGLWLVLGQN